MKCLIRTVPLFFLSTLSFAHGGGLDERGGHYNKTNNTYHCHAESCEDELGVDKGGDSNCNYPNSLQIVVVNIGQGDAILIATPSKILLADSGETSWSSDTDSLKSEETIKSNFGQNCKTIDYYINSHLHLDHLGYIQAKYDENKRLLNSSGGILKDGESLKNPDYKGGIATLVENKGFTVKKALFRDYLSHNPNRKPENDGSKTYWNWRAYLQSTEGKNSLHPETAILGDTQVQLGLVGDKKVKLNIIQVDGATLNNPTGCDAEKYFGHRDNTVRGDTTHREFSASENDLSVAFVLSLGEFDMFIGGDTSGKNDKSRNYSYHDTETCLIEDPKINQMYGKKIDILKVNHHGSDHSTNQKFLDGFSPKVSIVTTGDYNLHDHIKQSVLKRLLELSEKNKGAVYLSEAGIEDNNWSKFCLESSEVCAIIGDGEKLSLREKNELKDSDINIYVKADGSEYSIIAEGEESFRNYKSK